MVKEVDILPIFECLPIDLGSIQSFCYHETASTEIGNRLTKDEAVSLLEWMLAVRAFEQMVISLKDGKAGAGNVTHPLHVETVCLIGGESKFAVGLRENPERNHMPGHSTVEVI